MERPTYPSDLTDAQWKLIEPLLPEAKPGGRPREVDLREVLNGILYLVKGGIPWRMMPHDLPPWGTVHFYYRQWRLDGTRARILDQGQRELWNVYASWEITRLQLETRRFPENRSPLASVSSARRRRLGAIQEQVPSFP